ncbi:unnamed protein product [Amoebophrya sp. A120]|nr:unnamed protein product [Amoebophrya sp. A120]|eukprot:GSA120T00002071001.1
MAASTTAAAQTTSNPVHALPCGDEAEVVAPVPGDVDVNASVPPRRAPGLPRSQKKWLKRQREGESRAERRRKRNEGTKNDATAKTRSSCADQDTNEAHSASSSAAAQDGNEKNSGKTIFSTKPTCARKAGNQSAPTEEKLAKLESAVVNGRLKLAINCSFCADMNFKELVSLRKQIELSYGVLKTVEEPFQLHLTSFDAATNPLAAAWTAVRKFDESAGVKANGVVDDAVAEQGSEDALEETLREVLMYGAKTNHIQNPSCDAGGEEQHKDIETRPAPPSSCSSSTLKASAPLIKDNSIASYEGRRLAPLLRSLALHKWKLHLQPEPYWDAFERVIILSPDAEEPLLDVFSGPHKSRTEDEEMNGTTATNFDENIVFVVGGSVDRTVRKNQSLNQSMEKHVEKAVHSRKRLPLREFAPKGAAKILNIDTVLRMLAMKAAMEEARTTKNIEESSSKLDCATENEWREVFHQCLSARFLRQTEAGA